LQYPPAPNKLRKIPYIYHLNAYDWVSSKVEISKDSINYLDATQIFSVNNLSFRFSISNFYNGGLFVQSEMLNGHLFEINDRWSVENNILNLGKAGSFYIVFDDDHTSFVATSVVKLTVQGLQDSYYKFTYIKK